MFKSVDLDKPTKVIDRQEYRKRFTDFPLWDGILRLSEEHCGGEFGETMKRFTNEKALVSCTLRLDQ